jgi:dihydroorotate dehydrogenase (fumarate)
MADLSTTYMGLKLSNPVIVSSCGLTGKLASVKACAQAGAGAVVLKSIFEEQILAEVAGMMEQSEPAQWHPEAADYITRYGREDAVAEYLQLIRDARRELSLPIIASIHCVTAGTWIEFASRVEEAGADALELNVFILPSDPRRDGVANEKTYFDIAAAVKKRIKIPVALKIGSYFSGLSNTLTRLSHSGIDALVLFNRFFDMDFDIEALKLVPASYISTPEEAVKPLRWISLLAGTAGCDLAATTGIHDGAGVVKQLLAGAKAVHVCSTLYKHGVEQIEPILGELESWMQRHHYETIEAFRAKLSQAESQNPAAYLRVQFMKASVGLE